MKRKRRGERGKGGKRIRDVRGREEDKGAKEVWGFEEEEEERGREKKRERRRNVGG